MDDAGPDGAIFFNPLHPIAAKCTCEISITDCGNFTEAKTCEMCTVVLEVVSVAREAINQTSLVPRPHPLTRRNGLVNQVEFLGLEAHYGMCNNCVIQ